MRADPSATTVPTEHHHRLEDLLQRQSAGLVPLSAEEAQFLIQELVLQRQALQAQNEELRRGQTGLRTEAARHADFYELAPVGYFTLSRSGAIIQSNPGAARMTGLARAELQGRLLSVFVSAADQQVFKDFLQRVFATQSSQSCELVLMTSNRTPRFLYLEGKTALAGEECRVVAIDITGPKEADREMRRTNQWLHATQRISAVGGWAINHQTGEVWASPEARRIYGYGEGRLTVPLIQSFPLPQFRPALDRAIRSLIERGVPYEVEFQVKRGSDGAIIDLHSVAEYDPAEQIVFGVVHDNTAKKAAEAALRESEARYRLLVENVSDVIWIRDVEKARYLYYSPSVERLRGFTAEEAMQQSLAEALMPDSLAHVLRVMPERIAAARSGRQLVNIDEVEQPTKDGRTVWTEVTTRYIVSETGDLLTYGASRDITARKLAETALAENRALLVKLTEQVPGVVYQFRLHPDGRSSFPYTSPGIREIYGLTPEEVRADASLVFSRIHPDDYDMIVATIQESARTLQIYHSEFRVILPGQGVRWRLCDAKPERMPDGGTLWHGIISDITPRKTAEAELRKLVRAIEQSPVTIVITDPTGAIEYANPQFTKVTGYTLDEVQGKNPRVLKSGVQPAAVYRDLWATIGAGGEWRGELCNKRKDGSLYWEDASISPVVDEAGRITHYLAVKEDITAKRTADAQLHEQAALLDITHDAIMVTRLDRTITYWNRAAELLYEIPASEACGKTYEYLVYREPPTDFQKSLDELQQPGGWTRDRQQFTRSGKKIDVRVRATYVRDAQGAPKSILLVITNITESKKLEVQFLRAQRMESLGTLASGVAHDLNNVLTPILISVELLRPLAKAKHDHDMLQMLSDSARRGADIVQQLLLFGRGGDTPRSAMNAGGVVKEVGRMMRETFPKNLVLSIQAPADLRLVEADKTQIHQVLLNLCVNARDAMPQGGRLTLTAENIQVEATLATSHGGTRAGPYILLRVADTGTGISAANLEKIFDPFFTTKPIGEGTGLGLATVLGIVRSHEGFIVVNSTEGRGTTFEVYLPAAQSAVEAAASHSNPLALLGRGEWILIADDEESIRSVLQLTLAENNYHVLVASDGAEALGVFAQNAAKIKLVITDAMMPVMDGAQTLHALRRLNPQLPVIAISGISTHRAQFEKDFGPRLRFLSKPFTSELALHLVREALDEAYPENPPGRSAHP